MFRFIHAADIHLDSPLRGLETYPDAPVEQIRGAARRAFDNLIELALTEEVAFVLLAGDLFDGDWKDYNTGLYFMHRMGRLQEAGIRVFLVAGNHDAAGQLTRSLRLPENVTLFGSKRPETSILSDPGVAVHGQSFAARAVSEDLSQGYPGPEPGLFNIGLLHTSLSGRPGHEPYAPCSPEGLAAKGYDYWALGHVHQREIVAELPWIVFPGNIQGRHIRETGPRGCTLVTVADGRVVEVDARDLDVLRFALVRVRPEQRARLSDVLDLTRTALEQECAAASGRPLAVRVSLEGPAEAHHLLHRQADQLREEVRGLAATLGDVWLEKLIVATAPRTVASLPEDSPLAGLAMNLDSLDFSPAMLAAMVPDWSGLAAKLPAEMRDHELLQGGPQTADSLRRDVREMLLARLGGGRHED